MKFKDIRTKALAIWLKESGRKFKVTDNTSNAFECTWQNPALDNGFNHISIFCSLAEFSSHITDLLRDYRYDKYEYNKSENINEVLFRYYSRILLITSEIITDLQDIWILSNYEISTKEYNGLNIKTKREYQDIAREQMSIKENELNKLFNYINRICKHKTQNLHICNNHIKYHFEDFKSSNGVRKSINIGNIRNYIAYDKTTFEKQTKPTTLIVPKLEYIITQIINCYIVVNNLFADHHTKFEHICKHFEDK